jgi:hypothetical protein
MTNYLIYALYAVVIGQGIYKIRKTKSERLLYAFVVGLSCLVLQVSFKLPIEFLCATWGFFGFGVLLYKACAQNRDKSLIVFSGVFLCHALVFLYLGLVKMNLLS